MASMLYWCHGCNRCIRVRVRSQDSIQCADCGGGFVEAVESTPDFVRRSRRSGGDRSPFNPVIVLRGSSDGGGNEGSFEMYYDDGAGLGLRPLPESMSGILMGLGFDRLLDQLAQLETNGVGRLGNSPASKAAIESMPVVKIVAQHVVTESHCAVCKEVFELNSNALQMPCMHIYHSDCILPWLSIRNSCPVCRHVLPSDVAGTGRNSNLSEEDNVGLAIWRLPRGGFAVGRFTGGRRAAERELPLVYTEMDGGFDTAAIPRRISVASSGIRSRESSRFRRAFRNFLSFLGRRHLPRSSRPISLFNRSATQPSQRGV